MQAEMPVARQPLVPNAILGMIFFLATEIMLFAAFISAYLVNRANAGFAWPPAGQPRLPVAATAFNTLLLLASGVVLWLAWDALRKGKPASRSLLLSVVLGGGFVAMQGVEWIRLLQFGLTTHSSLYGAFFYMIVGAHGLHAMAGIAALLYAYKRLGLKPSLRWQEDRLVPAADSTFVSIALFWGFVVAVWPVLYAVVYLS